MAEMLLAATRSSPDHVQQLQQAQGNRLHDHESHPREGQTDTRSRGASKALTAREWLGGQHLIAYDESRRKRCCDARVLVRHQLTCVVV
jgi:hypothetical protein